MAGRIAIIQSNYIPWRGYFAMIAQCAAFVFLDSVQFTRRDWRTRNAIKTPSGLSWLTIPVRQKGNYRAPIDSIEIADLDWSKSHLRGIEGAYRRAQAFDAVFPAVAAAYGGVQGETSLSKVNQGMTRAMCGLIGIETPLLRDIDLVARADLDAMDPTQRLVALAKAAGGDEYLSGPSARDYLDESRFHDVGLKVAWMDYSACLAPYPQCWTGFEPAVSIVDTLLNLGAEGAREKIVPPPAAAPASQ